MGIEAAAAFGADAPPLAEQQGVAEQVGPDFQAVKAVFVALGADADQRRGFRKERELDGCGPGGSALFGRFLPGSVSPAASEYQRKV